MLHSDVSKESTDFIVLKLSHSNSDFGVKSVLLSNDGKIFVCDCVLLESLSRSLTLDPSGLGKKPKPGYVHIFRGTTHSRRQRFKSDGIQLSLTKKALFTGTQSTKKPDSNFIDLKGCHVSLCRKALVTCCDADETSKCKDADSV